jgi:hypothetical protein
MAALAIKYGHVEIFLYLEATGARVPRLQTEYVLKHIAKYGYAKFMKLCISRGIVMNEDYVQFAIEGNSLDTLKCLMPLSDLSILNRRHIEYSIESGKFEIFKYILKYLELELKFTNVKINYDTLLNSAVIYSRNDIIQYLVVAKGVVITKSIMHSAYGSFLNSYKHLTLYMLEGLGGGDTVPHSYYFPELNKHLAMYKAVYIRNRDKIRNRAASRIYFWWIQLCYPLSRPSGIRMAYRNLEEFETLCAS